MTPTILSPTLLSFAFLCAASIAVLICLLLKAKAQAFALLQSCGALREQLSGLTSLQNATADRLASATGRASLLECELNDERLRGAQSREQLRLEATLAGHATPRARCGA
jgi:hypothetical protein